MKTFARNFMVVLTALLMLTGFAMASPAAAGDIAFIAYNGDAGDNFAVVSLVAISNGDVIWFTDNEWNGTAFADLNEGEFQWTADADYPAGTVIVVSSSSGSSPTVNIGSITGSGIDLGASNETLLALLEQPSTSVTTQTFLAGISNDLTGSGVTLTGTGLTSGTDLINFANDHDGFKYTGARTGEATFAAYLPIIMNTSNWQDEISDGTLILPISTTSFTLATGIDDPTLTESSSTTTSITVDWDLNGNSDSVILVYKTTDDIGIPTDGVSYNVSDNMDGDGAIVIYKGSGTTYTHTGRTAGTTYYYKLFSYDGSTNYSAGVGAPVSTLKLEPSNQASTFAGTSNFNSVTLTWADNDGAVAADGFIIKASTTSLAAITAPTDGVAPVEDSNLSDGSGETSVAHGTQTSEWTALDQSTTYYFKIYPYTNDGTNIDYKTDGTVPEVTKATTAIPSLPLIENFDYTAGDYLTAHGWMAHSGSGTNPIQAVAPGLEFSGYAGSGIGNAADVGNTGEDDHIVFSEVSSGSIYASFIIKTGASNAAGYFLNFGQQEIGFTYFSRVWVNATGDGVGIGSSTPAEYVSITAGVPTLLVVKYTVSTGVSDLYVCNSVPSTEPVTPDATFTESSSYNVGSLALRQYSSSQDIIVDGIRISTSWNEAPLPITLTSFTAETNNGSVELAWETATETNNANFVIYRNNEAITSVAGSGSTSEPHNYSYIDEAVVPGVTYTYVLADVDYANEETKYEDDAVTVTIANDLIEADFVIGAAYPNPFNPSAVIPVELSRDAMVTASLYDLNGREVKTLVNANFTAGTHDLRIDGTGLSTGLYLVQVVVDNVINVQKIALMK